jgi:hypothetical protein
MAKKKKKKKTRQGGKFSKGAALKVQGKVRNTKNLRLPHQGLPSRTA